MKKSSLKNESGPKLLLWFEALILIFVSIVFLRIGYEYFQTASPQKKIFASGMIEAESMPILAKSSDFDFLRQSTKGFDGSWTNDSHMIAMSRHANDWIEFGLPDGILPGRYRLSVFLTKSYDYGVLRFSFNQKTVGLDQDLFSGGPILSTGPIKLGEVEVLPSDQQNKNILKLEVVGRNPQMATETFYFGIDGVLFEKL